MARVLTPYEVAVLVTRYGFADRVMACAIVLRESEGDPGAENTNDNGSIDRGLWQLNSVHLGSTIAGAPLTRADCHDVNRSTEFALALSKGGTSWQPWQPSSSVASGQRWADKQRIARENVAAVDKFLASGGKIEAQRPSQSTLDDTKDVISAVADPLAAVRDGAAKVLGVITSADFWKRAGLVLAGVVCIVIALVFVFGKDVAVGAAGAASLGTVDLDEPAQ